MKSYKIYNLILVVVFQMAFHERKEDNKNEPKLKKVQTEQKAPIYNQGQVQEINKKVDDKIQRVEENILQWIDEEAKTLKDTLEKDILSIRTEVDNNNLKFLIINNVFHLSKYFENQREAVGRTY